MGQKQEYSARSLFSNYSKPEKVEEETPTPVKQEVSFEKKNDLSSRVEVKNTAVPPWIEKLRNNRK